MSRVAPAVPSAGDIDPAGWLDRFDDMFARVVAPEFYQRSGPDPRYGNRLTTGSDGTLLTCLTLNEIRRMHAIFSRPAHPPDHHLHWSRWRRQHQATARQCHYKRRNKRDH